MFENLIPLTAIPVVSSGSKTAVSESGEAFGTPWDRLRQSWSKLPDLIRGEEFGDYIAFGVVLRRFLETLIVKLFAKQSRLKIVHFVLESRFELLEFQHKIFAGFELRLPFVPPGHEEYP